MVGQNYRTLRAWQRVMDLVERVYEVTRTWPKEETYGLTNLIRRAAVSVPSNMAEGQGRNTQKEFLAMLSIAHGSLREVETQLMIANRLRYLDDETIHSLMELAEETGLLLRGLIRSQRQQ